MGKYSKLREKILTGGADSNILCKLLGRLEFEERIRGDHHIFTRDGVAEIINLQSKGKKAKAYQVRQVRSILVKYRFGDINVD